MCKIQEQPKKTKNYKSKYEMQDIFKLYGDDYISRHKLNSMQLKALQDISTCRTSAMGYNARECNDCKNIEFAYNSCRNRNCPKRQGDKRYDWIEKRLESTLDVPYYHTPNQLFELAIYNQKIFYDILFKSSSDTLKQFANNLKWWDVNETTLGDKKPKIETMIIKLIPEQTNKLCVKDSNAKLSFVWSNQNYKIIISELNKTIHKHEKNKQCLLKSKTIKKYAKCLNSINY